MNSFMEVDETVRQAEAILRFSEEIDRRLAEHGLTGVEDLLQTYRQLRLALERVTTPELEWACREALGLSRQLEQISGELQRLRSLKSALEMQH
jgi:hypothetical protein